MTDPHRYGPAAERQEVIRTIVIEHDRFVDAYARLTAFHRPVRGGRPATGTLSMLIGDSRSGKTFVTKRYAKAHAYEVGETGMIMPVVCVEMPPEYVGGQRGVLGSLADALGLPHTTHTTNSVLCTTILRAIVHRQVELLILDEFEQLFRERSVALAGFGRALLRKILNLGTLGVVCVGLTETYECLRADEQLTGRGGLPYYLMRPYQWVNEDERTCFRLVCHAFDEKMPFNRRSGFGTVAMAERLFFVSEGNIGRLKWMIEAAAALAINDNSDCIQPEHFAKAYEHRMPLGTTFNPFKHELSQAPKARTSTGSVKTGGAQSVFSKRASQDLRDAIRP